MRKLGTWLVGAALAAAALGAASSANAALTSNVMGASGADVPGLYNPIVMTSLSGQAFDLQSLDLALGPLNPPGTDTVHVTGDFGGGVFQNVDIAVGYPFVTHTLNWVGLQSLTFSPLTPQINGLGEQFWGYLAFDNIKYATAGGGPAVVDFEDQIAGGGSFLANERDSGGMHFEFWFSGIYGPNDMVDFPTGNIPEPATWGLMILGFAGVGAMLRSSRRKAALA